jgi:hypothetical protein
MLSFKQDLTARVKSWLRPYLQPRRFHAYGVGMPKTGTHSLAAVFERYRVWHEPERIHFMELIMARTKGEISEAAARAQLQRLDRHLWLELNSSWTNYLLTDMMLEEFPRVKIVLTIRDCYSWLDSIFNEMLGRTHADYMVSFHRWYASSLSPGSHQAGDRVLAERGLWPLDSWLRAWTEHNSRIISMVPSDRLLVVRTQDIRSDIPRLAQFMGVPADMLDAGRSHEFKAEARFGLLTKIDEGYLRDCVEARCADLMGKFFPEIRGLEDVRGYQTRGAAPSAATTS